MNKFKSTLTILFFLSSSNLLGQQLMLEGKWKYSLKDDSVYAKPSYNDEQWKEKSGNNLMFSKEDLNTNSRYVWIRERIIIPASLKAGLAKTGALSIYLGHIFQADEVYFNGILIGKTNSSDVKSVYLLGPGSILWDKENTIAVRIRHWGDKAGSDISPPYIAAAIPAKVFELNSAASGVSNNQPVRSLDGIYQCIVINHSAIKAEAEIEAEFYDINNNRQATFHQKAILTPGNIVLKFPYRSPTSFLKVRYILSVPQYSYKAIWNDEFGYDDIPYRSAGMIVANKVEDQFRSPEFQQEVIEGWLGARMDANTQKRLLQVDEVAILAGYINRPGDHPWIGEHIGKFLDAASNTYKNSHNAELKIKLDRSAQKLIAAQLEDGYLGTYTPDNYWTSWDVWSHKYCMIGLLSYYSLSGYTPALEAAKKGGDLLCRTFGYGKGQLDIIAAGAHVGMAATSVLEPMVDLYRYTGDKKYLDFCFYIIKSYDQANGPKIISTLDATGRVDETANAKAYEMLSNILGIMKLYKVTGDKQFLKPVLLAWNDITEKRLYITGTSSSFEHFKGDDDLPATDKDNMGEGCVTTTWVQINYQLLEVYGQMKYLNELERSVYNHLTGAENPETGCVSYYTPLDGVKPYRCVITCCMSSVPRGISMIPLFANGKINGSPAFLFYQPGIYSTTVNNNAQLTFNTSTSFPADSNVTITVNTEHAVNTPVIFRNPYWAKDMVIKVNGNAQVIPNSETTTISRVWRNGDKVEISFKMPILIWNGGKSYPGQFAIQKGPQILVLDKSLNQADADKISIDEKHIVIKAASNVLPIQWVGKQAFKLKVPSNGLQKNLILVPYADASQTGGVIDTWLQNTGN